MMKAAILCAALAVMLPFIIGMAADRYGPDQQSRSVPRVADRFLERAPQYDADSLKVWINTYPDAARGYAFPVLFPLDLLFMLSIAGFCAFASLALSGEISLLANRAGLLLILPLLYLASDLIEDLLLFLFLMFPNAINPTLVQLTKFVSMGKIVTFPLAVAQTFLLAGAALIWRP